MIRSRASVFLFVAWVAACSNPGEDDAKSRTLALTDSSVEILDQRQTETGALALAGPVEPVPFGTDAPRVVVLEVVPDHLAAIRGARVSDARFTADGAVILGADGVLRHVTSTGTTDLARDALAPLSVEANRVAFAGGNPPDLVLSVVDLGDGTVHAVAPDLMPAWSPALSPDGSAVIFAASIDGMPRMVRATLGGTVEVLPPIDVVPSSPRAPIWRDGILTFDHEEGVVQMDPKSGEIIEEVAAAQVAVGSGDGPVQIVAGDDRRTLEVSDAR